jgi:L-threonylcarbamoyladenylate synthase
MPRIVIDRDLPNPEILAKAAELLRAGRLVAFPTETVYGLGANALDASAVARIYEAKGRPSYNPIIVHVSDVSAVSRVVREWTAHADALAIAFWPGPMTLVLPRQSAVPDIVTAGLDSVAVRVPAHPVARALLDAAKIPIAAPSANRSTELSPTTGRHVEKSLGDAVDLILDAGPTQVGIESTVVDLTSDIPTVLRPGTISVPEIERVVGKVATASPIEGETARPSPGMMDRHYAPHARVIVPDARNVVSVVERERAAGHRVGALVLSVDVTGRSIVQMPTEPLAYAARLYTTLHSLDESDCQVVVIEAVPDTPPWRGVRDRIERASRPG